MDNFEERRATIQKKLNKLFNEYMTFNEHMDHEIEKYKATKNSKGFRDQLIECTNNGNCIKIDTKPMKGVYGYDVGTILVCVKHRCICSSKACMNERFKINE